MLQLMTRKLENFKFREFLELKAKLSESILKFTLQTDSRNGINLARKNLKPIYKFSLLKEC